MKQDREVVRAVDRGAERTREPEHEGDEREARVDIAQAPVHRRQDLDPDDAAEEEEERGEEGFGLRRRSGHDDESD